MSKPTLIKEQEILEREIIATLIAGLKEWRSDLDYPQSFSDMQACVRGLMRMFDVKRANLTIPLKIQCEECKGGCFTVVIKESGEIVYTECPKCDSKGYHESF